MGREAKEGESASAVDPISTRIGLLGLGHLGLPTAFDSLRAGARCRSANRRIFNTYGQHMRVDDGRALPNFLMQALQGRSLTVYWRRQPDAQLVLCKRSGGKAVSAAGVGGNRSGKFRESGRGFCVAARPREILRLTGNQSPIRFEPLPTDDPRHRRPDIFESNRKVGLAAADRPDAMARDPLLRRSCGSTMRALSMTQQSSGRHPRRAIRRLQIIYIKGTIAP